MAMRLSKLRIEELSLVDSPANKSARVVLLKRDGGNPESGAGPAHHRSITEETVSKYAKLSPSELVAELEKRDAASRGGTPEDVLKGLTPEARSLVEKAQTLAAEALSKAQRLQDEADQRDRVAKAQSMVGAANVEPVAIANVLKQVDEEGAKTIADVFGKFNAVIKESGLFQSHGIRKADSEESDAIEQIEKRAVEIRKANPTLTNEQAFVEAMREMPEAYAAAEAADRGED